MRALLLLILLAPQDRVEQIVLQGGRIVTVSGAELETGMILIEDGRIRKIGASFEVPKDAKVIEVPKGGWILPGFIDVHSHLGSAFEAEEPTEALTPHVKAVEGFTSRHPDVREALASGVTTVALAPGNGNVVGGRIGVVKLNGERYDRALLRDAVALKVSLGGEALRRDREPTSRTGALSLLRQRMADLRELPLFVHASSAGEIECALDLQQATGVRMVLLHATEAASAVDRLRSAKVPVALAPLTVSDRKETLALAGVLDRAGVRLAFTSDAPATSEAHLRVSAAFAVKYGLDRAAALRALTSTPAELLGLAAEIGTLEEGKSADLVVWTGDPLTLTSDVAVVLVNGKVTHRRGGKP